MSRELDDDELRAILDRISAERATMKPGEYPEEQPMPDAAYPSPSEKEVVAWQHKLTSIIRYDRPNSYDIAQGDYEPLVRAAQVLRLTEEKEALRLAISQGGGE